jgi:hypothetical protein
MKLIHFTPDYFDKLVDFFDKAYPERLNHRGFLEYITTYLISDPVESAENVIVVDDQDGIAGVNMVLPAKLFFKNETFNTVWAYATYVAPEFRKVGDAGTLLLGYVLAKKWFFGVGLSDTSKKIHTKLRTNFIGTVSTYIKPNILSYRALGFILKSIKPKKTAYVFPDIINIRGIYFEKVHDKNALRTSDKGYYGENIIEFNHDRDFLRRRYMFQSGTYTIYQAKNYNGNNMPFFVIRPVIVRGVNCLLLVDYRIDIHDLSFFVKILKALGYIVRKTGMAAMIVTASLDIIRNILRKRFWIRAAERDIVTNFTKEKLPVFITPGDSDYEFNYAGNDWRGD